jgi:hypothetical protein
MKNTDMEFIEPKRCLHCNNPLRGRIDKKFCDDYCRNTYNNQQKTKEIYSPLVRSINNVLLRNRRLLDSLLSDGQETTKASGEKLMELGFQFKYFTHLHKTRQGKTYHYCYDRGYLPLENDWFLVVRKKETRD